MPLVGLLVFWLFFLLMFASTTILSMLSRIYQVSFIILYLLILNTTCLFSSINPIKFGDLSLFEIGTIDKLLNVKGEHRKIIQPDFLWPKYSRNDDLLCFDDLLRSSTSSCRRNHSCISAWCLWTAQHLHHHAYCALTTLDGVKIKALL